MFTLPRSGPFSQILSHIMIVLFSKHAFSYFVILLFIFIQSFLYACCAHCIFVGGIWELQGSVKNISRIKLVDVALSFVVATKENGT